MRKQKILFFIIIGAAILVALLAPWLQRRFGPPDLSATATVMALRSTKIALAATEVALTAPPPTPTASTLNPILGGQKTWNGLHIQVTDVQTNAWPLIQAYNQNNTPPLPGKRMLLVTLKITAPDNKEDTPLTIDDTDFKVVGERKKIYTTYSEETRCGVIPGRLGGVVTADFPLTGSICVQTPENEEDFVLIYEDYTGSQPAIYISLPKRAAN